MKDKRCLYPILLFSLVISSLVSSLVPMAGFSQGAPLWKPAVQKKNNRPLNIASIPFTLPSLGAPGKRKVGAARRPNCPWLGDYLTALLPGTNIGLTLSKHPTFWFDVPYGACGLSVEFQLNDDQEHSIYRQVLPVQGTPGLVSIRLPHTVVPLESGKVYRWRFTILLDPGAPFDDARGPVVEGAILRIDPSAQFQQSFGAASPRERLILYGKNGLWFDLLAELGERYRANPQDQRIGQDWRNVLQQAGLTYVASKPLTTCCSLRSQQ